MKSQREREKKTIRFDITRKTKQDKLHNKNRKVSLSNGQLRHATTITTTTPATLDTRH